ncbi:unnamed protein product [Cochlearia groenlandica]
MSSEVKQLIVVAEGTAALGPYWHTIVSDYLEKIIRSFCAGEVNGERNTGSVVELSLVIFNSHGSYCACLVQRSGWTRDVDTFMHWLSSIQFGGGGFNEAATAEGLSEALMMFSPPTGQAQPSNDLKRHCILITASNPYSLPTPVYRPKVTNAERNENGDVQSESRLSDAETVASYFSKCSVSLSVVCPKQLPKIRALYNAGKLNPKSADLSIDAIKHTFYLVLISEKFVEARAALSNSATNLAQTQSPVKVDRATVAQSLPVIGQPPASVPSANGPILNRQPVSAGAVPTATVKVEPSTVSSMAAAQTFPHIPSVARPAAQAIPSIQTSSASPVSQEMVTNAENVPDIKPVVSGMTPPLRTGPPGGANVNLLNNLSQVRQVMSSAALAGAASSTGQSAVAMHMSNMISTGMATSLPPSQTVFSSGQQGVTSVAGSGALMGTAQVGQNPGPNNSFSPQTTVNVSQPMQGMSQGSHSAAQMMQGGISMNQNMMSGLGQGNVSSGTGGMMPTPGVNQQAQSGVQQLGAGNNSAPNMQLPQQSSGAVQTTQSKYIKVWEGNLSGQRQGQPVLITRLEGYRSNSASESLAANWPPTMQIVRLISQDHMNNKQYVGKADFLVFRAMSQHGFLGQLQDKKLCAVIQLPSQTLLLSVSDKACRLIGMLFPGDMVVFKPQIPNQQQQQQMQQQHQQQLQQQQQQQQQQIQQQQQHHQQLPQLQQQHQLSQLQHHQQQQQLPQHQLSQLQHHQMQQQTSSPLNHMQQQSSPLNQMQQQTSPLNQMQQQSSPLNQMQQQTSPLNQMQQQPQQMVGSGVMGGQGFTQGQGRTQQGGGGGGQPNMQGGAAFM